MAHDDHSTPPKKSILSPKRLALLASVAALGGGLIIGGSGNVNFADVLGGAQQARAAEPAKPLSAKPAVAPVGFADLVAKVKPAVISVRVTIEQSMNGSHVSDVQGDNNLPPQMRRFFQQFGQQFGFPNMPNTPHRKEMITGLGSGFFISPDGYAVTNNHVVANAKTVQVKTDDGHTYKAKVIGTDPKTDLALIKVDSNKTFPYVKFASTPPRIGDWVVAVGNPFGLNETVTAGIVSATGRDIGGSSYDDYIQIDAPINKGNSGGPAFNTNGDVIGVNTAIFSPSGGSVGIGFDIPAKTVKLVVAQLKAHGYVNHAYLGVKIQTVSSGIADSLGMKSAHGAIVDQIMPDSPAAKTGLKTGDVITAVNGQSIKGSRDLARTIGMMAPDSKAKLTVLHDGQAKTVEVTLAKSPQQHHTAKANENQKQASNGLPKLGLTLAPANDVAGSGGQGVAVINVDPSGPAAARGFKSGDIILDVGGHTVSTPDQVQKAMREARNNGKQHVLMRVKAPDGTRFIAVPVGKA